MKALVIVIVLGAVGYFVFFYEPNSKPPVEREVNEQILENQRLLDEAGIENKSYQGAITETYDSIKSTVESAKDSVLKIEEKSQTEY